MLLVLVAYERMFHRPSEGPVALLPGFHAADVESVQVLPPNAPEIRVHRTNDTWELTRPLAYPAQAASIEALLQALEDVVPATVITAGELQRGAGDHAAYGLDTPRASLVLSIRGERKQLLIGALTAPGDQVFVQVVGREGISVIDAELLKLIPVTPGMWRDTEVFDQEEGSYDSIVVTTGGGVLELRRDPKDRSWQIVRPMQARANGVMLERLIQGLKDLTIKEFVSDDPKADREAWGLQPPDLQIRFAQGTNTLQVLQFGHPVQARTNAIYAVGRDPSSVVVVDSSPLGGWRATPNEFRDRQLIRIPRDVASIEVGNGESFTLVNTTNGTWRIDPLGIPGDAATVQRFVQHLQALRVTQFVKDVVADPDLPEYGLETPAFHVTIRSRAKEPGQPAPALGLEFGAHRDGAVFVRRVDENAVYALGVEALESIPAAAGHFRRLKLWAFSEDQVESVAVQKGEGTWRLSRNGLNQWSLAPGSQGIVNAFGVEEAAHQLGALQAVVWTDWNQENLARYGLDEDSVTLTVELKDGSRKSLRFGFPTPSGHVYAGTLLEGGVWVFEFPGDAFDLVQSFLIAPSNLR